MIGCQHPADKASFETLLLRCPDCGAECSETSIGDDRLCYDEACPLHAMAGPTRAVVAQIYWDTSDPANEGWAYSYQDAAGQNQSGGLDSGDDQDADPLPLCAEVWAFGGIDEIRVFGDVAAYLVYRGPNDWRRL